MGESLQRVGAITLFIDDHGRAKRFYEQVFGAPAVHEDGESIAFKFENVIVNLLIRSSAPELITPAEVADGGTGADLLLTISVDDADAACAQVTSRGGELLNGPVDRPWGVRTAAFADPDGHIWELAGPIPQQSA